MASRRARSVLQWLSNPRGGASILRGLLTDGVQITHETLDRLDERQVWSLRRTLVQITLLPVRHEALERLTPFLRDVVAELPGDQRQLVSTYGTWWVLRRARRQLERTGRFTVASKRSAQRRLSAAVDFVGWLDAQHIAMSDLTQADVDRWLDVEDYRRADLADFLRWASRRRLVGKLKVHRRPGPELNLTLGEEARWRLLDRCLHDGDVPDDVRAAGALVLLYGIQLSRIVELTTAHLHRHPPATGLEGSIGLSVTLTGPEIALPPALAAILSRLPMHGQHPRPGPLIVGEAPGWLFPGFSATGHLNSSVLSKHLNSQGISPRPARNAALISLAGELPISVLSDLFDISISTAMHWARRAGRDWNAYLAATHQERSATAPALKGVSRRADRPVPRWWMRWRRVWRSTPASSATSSTCSSGWWSRPGFHWSGCPSGGCQSRRA